jgi:hypothetical protein
VAPRRKKNKYGMIMCCKHIEHGHELETNILVVFRFCTFCTSFYLFPFPTVAGACNNKASQAKHQVFCSVKK